MTAQEFFEQWRLKDTNSPHRFSFDADGNFWVAPSCVVDLMQAYAELYAKEKHKEARHAAAEIVSTIGERGGRDISEAHRDIMNLKF